MTFTKVAPANTLEPRVGARPSGIPVLPAVDVNLGTVTFHTPSGHHAYWSAEPTQLVQALTQAVRPAQWIPEIGTLVITVAQTGIRSGRGLGFKLFTY
ncbi:hypothetical protein [Arthrobacter polaris]|uniref:hypothetical protein n=1 Tax=Arthrobacter polaris TaxID=2813727 RepID=UPI001F189809|nr:hypothetical protein [Arthrobacter polaris]UIK89178.1 hypothetical protein J0916_01445 [Arthrobacter polaris]